MGEAEIIAALTSLSPAELKRVRGAASQLLVAASDKNARVLEPGDEQIYYAALVDRLKDGKRLRGAPEDEGKVPIARLPGFDPVEFREAIRACKKFATDALGGIRRDERVGFWNFIADCAWAWTIGRGRETQRGLVAESYAWRLRAADPSAYGELVPEFVDAYFGAGISISVATLIRASADPERIIDYSFPGYTAGGLLRVMWNVRSSVTDAGRAE